MSDPEKTNGHVLDPFRSYLYLLARTQLGPTTQQDIDASDLVQQTLMDAHANRDQFRGESDAQRAAWLRQILSNNIADALRHLHRAKRDVSRQRSLDEQIDESFCQAHSWLEAMQSSPSQHAMKEEDLLRLADALMELSDVQRDAVILRHLQGLSLAEVSRELRRSEAAVAGLVFRGLNNLKRLLDVQE